MSELVSMRADYKTPIGYLDNSRPLAMNDADKIFKQLQLRHGNTASDALTMAMTLTDLITSTKSHEIDQLWGKLEKKLNGGLKLSVKAKTDEGKVNTAVSMLYSALNWIDKAATTTRELHTMRNLVFKTDLHVTSKFVGKMKGVDKRTGLRVSKTTSERLDTMVERFNELLEAGLIGGSKL